MEKIEYLRPKTLIEAVELKSRYGKAGRVLSGGTDLLVNLRDRALHCTSLIDIKAIPEMKELSFDKQKGLTIGGAVTLNELIENPYVKREYPVLVESAINLANSLLRNRATLLGNICNASPAGDMIPSCLVLEGAVEAVSVEGTRIIPLKEFFLGVKKNALKDSELAVRVILPPNLGEAAFSKKSRIKGHDLSQLCVAGMLKEDGMLSIALGAAGPVPVLVNAGEKLDSPKLKEYGVQEEILQRVRSSISPISDQRASREYRMAMAEYLVLQVINKISKEV